MDPRPAWRARRGNRLPRLRGDGPHEVACYVGVKKVAPPTRGWTPLCLPYGLLTPGCPAYAGMDPIAAAERVVVKGLPRLRGDGPLSNRH